MNMSNQKNKLKIPTKKLNTLVEDVSRIYVRVRQEQVRAAWEIGQRIVEEEQDGEAHAQYNSHLIRSLSKELTKRHGGGFSYTNLSNMRRFYLENKKIQPAEFLTWTNHVELLPVKDIKTRRHLERRAIEKGLKKNEVRQLVRQANRDAAKSESSIHEEVPQLKPLTNLVLNTCSKSKFRKELRAKETLIDCGFFIDWPATKEDLAEIVVTDKPSYTYGAVIERVVDADSLNVAIDVGFGIILHERLRLHGINAPERDTSEGAKAKRYVQQLLPLGAKIILKSHKTKVDIYGRFVVDVFFKKGETNPQEIIDSGTYLNQHLLDCGHAVVMKM